MEIENDLASIHEYFEKQGFVCGFDLAMRVSEELEGSSDFVPEVVVYQLGCLSLPLVSTTPFLGGLIKFAMVRKLNWNGYLETAVREGDLWATLVALEHADPRVSVEGGSLLHVATPFAGIVLALIDAGTDLHAMNELGLTPLDVADAKGHTESALQLLCHGAKRSVHE